MKITITTLGTRGDVEPCIALGNGLQSSGHEVRIAAPVKFENLVRERGVGFFPIKNGLRQMFEAEPGRDRLQEELNPIRLLYRRKEVVEPIINEVFSDLWSASRNTDVMLYTVLALPAYYIAKDMGIPAFPACFQPLSRTRTFPSVFSPALFSNIEILNRASHLLTEQGLWWFYRSAFSRWRKKAGLSALPYWGHFRELNGQNNPVFNGYSPLVVPKPDDWGGRKHVTGYWFLDPPSNWRPDPVLVDFIKNGKPPICIGFGSMNDNRVEETVKISIEALKKTNNRGVFLSGQSDINREELPQSDDIFVVEKVPHSWLFPKVSAVIHHGGAGTTAAAIKAGVPSIIIPFFFDQLFWGRRLADLEVGPQPLPRKRLSVESLASAINETVNNKKYRNRIQKLSDQVRAEDGVKNAVNAFHHELSSL